MATTPNISLSQLSSSVGPAVKAALQRNQAKTTGGFVFNPGVLAGPILELSTDLKVAQKIADDITAQVQRSQSAEHTASASTLQLGTLQSGVLITHTHIICGFFPYPAPLLQFGE